jgi:hypothetical protein
MNYKINFSQRNALGIKVFEKRPLLLISATTSFSSLFIFLGFNFRDLAPLIYIGAAFEFRIVHIHPVDNSPDSFIISI